jgi:4-alpha-glucanotransferase
MAHWRRDRASGPAGGTARPGLPDDRTVTDPELARRAQAAGVDPRYWNWLGQETDVPDDALAAILAALDAPAPPSALAPAPPGPPAPDTPAPDAPAPDTPAPDTLASLDSAATADALASGPDIRAPLPGRRSWGLAVQLYAARSRQSWGHGDLRDLADLAVWSGRDLGAGFVLVSPLHAAEPLPPVSPSPYLPMTRRYSSPLYLRIEDIPEYAALPAGHRAEIARLAGPLRAASGKPGLIDRDAVWAAKRAALELIRQVPLPPARRAALLAYRQREGDDLACWSAWCALAEAHGPDWRRWPAPLRDPAQGLAAAAAGPLRDAAAFHEWVQWLVDEQLAAAQAAALGAGMAIGLIHDLAVGVHPGGADAWAHQDLLVQGVSVGAPPDSFNQRGQDWSQPPWHPRRLAAAGYRPLAGLFAAALRHAGGLRVDHVMGLTRLWWVPAGRAADHGAYVRYDHAAAVAALAGQAALAGAVAIGEDLGTVEDWVRAYLAERSVLGTEVLWFATGPGGAPRPPGEWRAACMATVGTHDLPTVTGFWSGDQVTVRAGLGLLATPEDEERQRSASVIAAWSRALESEGLVPPGGPAGPAEFTVALYGYLARTPALLLGVSLADAVGDVRSQNIPGTTDQYPNWRVPLCDEAGAPVLIEDLPGHPLLLAVTRAVQSS